MHGCACDPPARSLKYCSCKAKPILDDTCDDSTEWEILSSDAEWETLSSDMDKEEPNAAQIIAIAFNKRNKVAMSIGHLEILRTLKSLCNPDPVTFAVPYDQVEAAMIKKFGSTVKDAAYYKVYQLVMTSGGKNSETWNDFFKWGDIYIDESRRLIKLETYGILAKYPVRFRNIVKMQLKHTWVAKAQAGTIHLPLPTSIEHRLADEGGKHAWPDLMKEVEDVGHYLPELSSTVVGEWGRMQSSRPQTGREQL